MTKTKQTVQLRTSKIHKTRRQAGGFINVSYIIFAMVKIWVASRLKLPRGEVGGWCPTDWAMEFSHGPLTQVVKYICPSPTVCPCHHRVTCILTDLTVVSMSVLLVVLACHVDSCHSLLRDGVRPLSLTHGRCSHDIVDRYLLEISFDQWTRAVDLTGLRVAALGSSEVLLSDPVDASHLLVKSQFRSLGLTWGRCPHDIADSSLLKMTPELWSGLTSVVCWQTFVLAKCFHVLTDGGSVLPTPECWNKTPMAWCMSLNCFAADALDGLMSLAFCNARASDFSLCLGLESWVCSCLPARLVHHL